MRALLAGLVLIVAASSVAAEHCEWIDSGAEVRLNTPDGLYYVDNDVCQPECLVSVVVYKETNGLLDLQRAPAGDFCYHEGEGPDTPVFETGALP